MQNSNLFYYLNSVIAMSKLSNQQYRKDLPGSRRVSGAKEKDGMDSGSLNLGTREGLVGKRKVGLHRSDEHSKKSKGLCEKVRRSLR